MASYKSYSCGGHHLEFQVGVLTARHLMIVHV